MNCVLTTLRLCIAAGVFVLLSGCSHASGSESAKADASLEWSEYGTRMAQCMTAAGWDVTVDSGGGAYTTTIPAGQQEVVEADQAACEAELGFDKPPVFTQKTLRDLYLSEIETVKCLEDEGFPQSAPPPSLQEFLDRWGTADSFFAYKEVLENGLVPGTAWDQLNDACPQPTVD